MAERKLLSLFFGVLLLGSIILYPVEASTPFQGSIPPTRAFANIKHNTDTIKANGYNGNVTFSNGTGITIELFPGNNTVKFSSSSTGTNLTGYVNNAANVGTGTGLVFRDKTSSTLNFKTIKPGTGITITNNADDVTIDSTVSGGLSKANNLDGGDAKIFATNTTTQVTAKTLTAGSGITITNGTKTITITATGTGGFTKIYGNPGGDARVVKSNQSNTGIFKSFTSGGGISITNGSDTLTITNTRTTESTTGSNLGTAGQGIFSALVGFDLQFKKLFSSTLSLSSNSTNVIIKSIIWMVGMPNF